MPKFGAMVGGLLSIVGCRAMTCPSSPAWLHASAKVTATASASCEAVKNEMMARVQGQSTIWHDPHNNGTYAVISNEQDVLSFSRLSGNRKYTDKMTFSLSDENGKCSIQACSASQVFSIADFSTNYCNLRMLYCGSSEGCKPVKHDFATEEVKVSSSRGAGKDKSACLKVSSLSEGLQDNLQIDGNDTVSEALGCISANCPMDVQSMSPNPLCVLEQCFAKVSKCVLDTDCRNTLLCESKCTSPLAKTDDAQAMADLMNCMRDHCPGFPPSTSCVALHCGLQAGKCGMKSKCRTALSCSQSCIPSSVAKTINDKAMLISV